MSEGELKGQVCNRNNCTGILESNAGDEGCSCHIAPPCGSCTAGVHCTECNYDSDVEYEEMIKDAPPTYIPPTSNNHVWDIDFFAEKVKSWNGEDVLTYIAGGWGTGMYIKGICPLGLTTRQVLEKTNYNSEYYMARFDYFRSNDKYIEFKFRLHYDYSKLSCFRLF